MTPRIETEALQALVIDHLSDLVAHFADEAAKLQREVERLRAVIEPFEGAAGIFDQNGKFVGGPGGARRTDADYRAQGRACRRARRDRAPAVPHRGPHP